MGKKKTIPPQSAKALAAQGQGTKRTPQSAFDGAAGKDIYEPEKVCAHRMAKGGITQYQVKWKGWESKHSTWEPLENLAGCEDMIADFKERDMQRCAELEAIATAKRIEKEQAAAQKAKDDAEAASAQRLAAQAAGTAPIPDAPSTETETSTPTRGTGVKTEGSRRTAPIWGAFDTSGADRDHAYCKLRKGDGELCGDKISIKTGPAGLWNHCMYIHKEDYIRLKPATEKLDLTIDPQTKMPALASKHRDAIHKAISRWIVKRKRALSLPEDPEFHDIFKVAMRGAYTPPDHKLVVSNVLLLSGEGKKKLFDVNTALRAEGIKPGVG